MNAGPGQYNIDKSVFPLDKLKGSSSFLSKVERVNPWSELKKEHKWANTVISVFKEAKWNWNNDLDISTDSDTP